MSKHLTLSLTMRLSTIVFVAVMVMTIISNTASAQTLQCNWDGTYSLDPILNPQSNPWLQSCINERCLITTNSFPTTNSTDNIACNNNWATEINANCSALQDGYNAFFACVYANLANNLTQVTPDDQNTICVRVQSQSFITTPGFPYHMTNLTQYATDYFTNNVSLNLKLNSDNNNRCPNLPRLCCLQSPLSTTINDDGKYYNYTLCGIGCKTGLFLMAFTIISIAMFVCCGLCWPTPSLKQTAKQYKEEEAAAIAAACRGDDIDSETYNPDEGNNLDMVIQRSTVYLQESTNNVHSNIYGTNMNSSAVHDNNNNDTNNNTTNNNINPLHSQQEVQHKATATTTVNTSNK